MRSAAFGPLYCTLCFVSLVFGFAFALFQKPREYLLSLSSAICERGGRCENWGLVSRGRDELLLIRESAELGLQIGWGPKSRQAEVLPYREFFTERITWKTRLLTRLCGIAFISGSPL